MCVKRVVSLGGVVVFFVKKKKKKHTTKRNIMGNNTSISSSEAEGRQKFVLNPERPLGTEDAAEIFKVFFFCFLLLFYFLVGCLLLSYFLSSFFLFLSFELELLPRK